jgi:hypothetical protein
LLVLRIPVSQAMPTWIELPDLLSKLKEISYGHYQLDLQQQPVFITLFAHQSTTRFLILDPLSSDKHAEPDLLRNQYCS